MIEIVVGDRCEQQFWDMNRSGMIGMIETVVGAKIEFSRKSFLMDFGIDFRFCFGSLGKRFMICWALDTGVKTEGFFGHVTDPEPRIWGRRSTSGMDPLKRSAGKSIPRQLNSMTANC